MIYLVYIVIAIVVILIICALYFEYVVFPRSFKEHNYTIIDVSEYKIKSAFDSYSSKYE